jgi:hypothetical protein
MRYVRLCGDIAMRRSPDVFWDIGVSAAVSEDMHAE